MKVFLVPFAIILVAVAILVEERRARSNTAYATAIVEEVRLPYIFLTNPDWILGPDYDSNSQKLVYFLHAHDRIKYKTIWGTTTLERVK